MAEKRENIGGFEQRLNIWEHFPYFLRHGNLLKKDNNKNSTKLCCK